MATSEGAGARLPPIRWFELLFPGGFTMLPSASPAACAVVAAHGVLGEVHVACAVFDFSVMGGSLDTEAADALVAALSLGSRLGGVVVVVASGGIRLQEGNQALFQMPRLMIARHRLAVARRPLICVATDPTMGGVAGSIVGAADVIVAEPGARLALGGPRASATAGGTARLDSAEEALAAGVVDCVMARSAMPATLGHLLRLLCPMIDPSA